MPSGKKQCLQCAHALRDPNAQIDQIMIGRVPHLCLAAPPVTQAFSGPQGSTMLVTMYPSVNADTYSCASFAAKPAADGPQLIQGQ